VELLKEILKREDKRSVYNVHRAIFKEQIEKQNLNLKPSQPKQKNSIATSTKNWCHLEIMLLFTNQMALEASTVIA